MSKKGIDEQSVEPELPSTVSHLTRQPSATPVNAVVMPQGVAAVDGTRSRHRSLEAERLN